MTSVAAGDNDIEKQAPVMGGEKEIVDAKEAKDGDGDGDGKKKPLQVMRMAVIHSWSRVGSPEALRRYRLRTRAPTRIDLRACFLLQDDLAMETQRRPG